MPSPIIVRAVADEYLDSIRSANACRAYANVVDKTTDRHGEARPLADVVDDEIGEAPRGTDRVIDWMH
ncbi:hypothetical protein [Nocardia rhamnosiphila]